MKFGNIEAEKAVLGTIKESHKIIDDLILRDEYFLNPKNRIIYKELCEMHNRNEEISDIAFYERIKGRSDILPSDYISIQNHTTANVMYYVDIVKKQFMLEKLRLLGLEVDDRVKSADPGALIEYIDKYLLSINTERGKKIMTNQEVIMSATNTLEKRYNDKTPRTIKTGINAIDDIIGGFENGTFNIIAARPSIGKTSLALFMAYENARRCQTGFFSLEMVEEQLHDRITSLSSGVKLWHVKNDLNLNNLKMCLDGLSKYFDRTLFFDDTQYIPFRELKSKIRQMVRHGAQIIFIDYLTLIKYSIRGIPRFEAIGRMSKELKRIAGENKIRLVALSQLKRDAEDKEPSLADLRQCGELEEDADSVFLLHRKRDSNELQIKIAKNRHGPTGTAHVFFDQETGSFYEAR